MQGISILTFIVLALAMLMRSMVTMKMMATPIRVKVLAANRRKKR